MSLPRHFGATVRRLRDEKRWSQELLADKADINRSFLGEIERGSAVPTLATMDKLSRALDLRLSALIQRCEAAQTPEPPPQPALAR